MNSGMGMNQQGMSGSNSGMRYCPRSQSGSTVGINCNSF